jgi:hypothetical protein
MFQFRVCAIHIAVFQDAFVGNQVQACSLIAGLQEFVF